MDERELRKLAAAAEHERWVADRAAGAVAAAGWKLAKAEALVDVARSESREAADQAEVAETRALAAEQAHRDAADSVDVVAAAQPATGRAV